MFGRQYRDDEFDRLGDYAGDATPRSSDPEPARFIVPLLGIVWMVGLIVPIALFYNIADDRVIFLDPTQLMWNLLIAAIPTAMLMGAVAIMTRHYSIRLNAVYQGYALAMCAILGLGLFFLMKELGVPLIFKTGTYDANGGLIAGSLVIIAALLIFSVIGGLSVQRTTWDYDKTAPWPWSPGVGSAAEAGAWDPRGETAQFQSRPFVAIGVGWLAYIPAMMAVLFTMMLYVDVVRWSRWFHTGVY